MYKVVKNLVQVPLKDVTNDLYRQIEMVKKGTKYAYYNLEQYEEILSILNDTKFKKGDLVYWFKDYSSKVPLEINEETVNTNRIDVVTRVNLSFDRYDIILGDEVRYSTKEVNGDKLGIAYETYLIKVSEYEKINGIKK